MPFDFAAVSAPFRMQPGLRRVEPGTRQLTPNRPGDRALREKLGVLRAHAEQALCSIPAFDAGPALQALAAQAAREHAAAWQVLDGGHWAATQLGWAVRGEAVLACGDAPASTDASAEHAVIGACLSALPAPWRAAGLLALAFAEDFAILDGASATIPWIAACLPSHWAPEDKIGRHFADVHAPVADNQTLIAAGEHLARLVTGAQRWERFVWTVTRHEALSQHPARADRAPWPPGASADELVARAFFRTEHQTFIPLPERAQAVFTILIELRPLADAAATPAQAAQLHAAIASMSPAVLAYRGLTDARERLLAWLAARAAA